MNESERWVTLSALGAAMFAVGFSCASVACSSRDLSVEATPAPLVSATLGSSAATPVTSSVGATSGAHTTPQAPEVSTTATSAHDGLKVKRFVVTRKISEREPVVSDEFSLGGAPIYAFIELENAAREARSIRVVFQNQDTRASVGHVKLTVPAAQTRYRTWGNTRLIQDPGHWVAVVSTNDGTELGRAAFDVKG